MFIKHGIKNIVDIGGREKVSNMSPGPQHQDIKLKMIQEYIIM